MDTFENNPLIPEDEPEQISAPETHIPVAEEPQPEVVQMQRYGHVTVLACGEDAPEDAVLFNEADYVQQLTQIEI